MLWQAGAVSFRAVAAALALEDVSIGERLTAFSLASFANREHRAWPGARLAAARAGLSRSQYLHARGQLAERGVVALERCDGRAAGSAVVHLGFAEHGAWTQRPRRPDPERAELVGSPLGGRLAALDDRVHRD